MKLNRRFCYVLSIIAVLAIILTSTILNPIEKINKNKVSINYNKRITNKYIQNSDEIRVPIFEGSSEDNSVIQLPVPDTSKELILDALSL